MILGAFEPINNILPMKHTKKMKCGDWMFCIKYCAEWIMHGLLPEPALNAWLVLTRILKAVLKYEFTHEDLGRLKQTLLIDIAYLDEALPTNCLGLWYHHLIHIPEFIELWGPPYGYWMMRFERHISVFGRMRQGSHKLDHNVVNRFERTQNHSTILRAYQQQVEQVLPTVSN